MRHAEKHSPHYGCVVLPRVCPLVASFGWTRPWVGRRSQSLQGLQTAPAGLALRDALQSIGVHKVPLEEDVGDIVESHADNADVYVGKRILEDSVGEDAQLELPHSFVGAPSYSEWRPDAKARG